MSENSIRRHALHGMSDEEQKIIERYEKRMKDLAEQNTPPDQVQEDSLPFPLPPLEEEQYKKGLRNRMKHSFTKIRKKATP